MANRPASISIKNFSAAVDAAAKLAAEKNQTQLAQGLHIGPIITGKVARPKDLGQAQTLAADLTSNLTRAGAPLAGAGAGIEPAVLIRGGIIICGFIAPELEFHE